MFTGLLGPAVSLLEDARAPIGGFLGAGSRVFIKIVLILIYHVPIAVFGYAA